MVLNGNNVNNIAPFELLRVEAGKLGIEALALDVRKPEDVDVAFDKVLAFGAKGLLNAVDTFINSRRFAVSARPSTGCRSSTAIPNTCWPVD
jgi:putative tryptophan/tyrosine transport system substrate-binding protein